MASKGVEDPVGPFPSCYVLAARQLVILPPLSFGLSLHVSVVGPEPFSLVHGAGLTDRPTLACVVRVGDGPLLMLCSFCCVCFCGGCVCVCVCVFVCV